MKTLARTSQNALAMLALLALALIPASAAVANDEDPLAQVLDPNQAQGTGQVVRDHGHVDFGPTLNTGEWIIQIHDDTEVPSYWRHLEDVVLQVNDDAILTVPDDEAYGFLGQEPGSKVWVVPQTQKSDVVWAGWNTQEPTVLDSLSLGTTLSVLGVEGPGDVIVYLQSGNFGDPEMLWSSLEPFPQQSWIEVNTHTHANWVFSEPGIYLVEIRFEAELISGETVSATDTLRFSVGDATDPDPAFDMTVSDSNQEAVEGDEAPSRNEPEEPTQTSSLGLIVWVVVAVIALALIVAVLTVATASRRAKARALAARQQKAGDA